MNARSSVLALIVLPPVAALLVGIVFTAPTLRAQFDLGRLKRGIDKARSTTQQVTDTAKQVTDTTKDVTKIAKGVLGIGPEEERLIGEAVAVEIIGKHGGILRDEAITRRLNVLGLALAHYSTRPALNWRFAVLDSPSINGFSAPSGYVFLTKALYEKVAASDDALAAVLAHEISHVTERHALKIIARGDFVAGTTKLAVKHSRDAAYVQSQLREFDTGIGELAKTILEKGFDPKTELAADKGGRALAVTVGYAPGALRHVLVQLQQAKGDPKVTFATHPPLAERIKSLPKDPEPPAAKPIESPQP
jgi:beta-barrel assembly-enhancing protease